ncbi:MAG: hypothetical protein ABI831_22525 [Betaproteobacteria bacterium]
MSLAMQQWDGFIQDISRARDQKEIQQIVDSWIRAATNWRESSDSWQARAEAAETRMLNAESEVCGGFALQTTLEQFITKCYPNHPLVQDKILRGRVYDAGVKAGNLQNSYGAAREAGRTFAMPREVLAPLIETREQNTRLDELLLEEQRKNHELTAQLHAKAAPAQSLEALQAELSRVIRDCAHHMAQSAAFREQLTQVDPENPLIRDAALRRRIADEAYRQLELNGGSDWNVVKEVGRTFSIPNRTGAGGDARELDLVHEIRGGDEAPAVNPDELHEPPEHLELIGAMHDPVGFLEPHQDHEAPAEAELHA